MKKIFYCLCLAFMLLFVQGYAQTQAAPKEKFTTTKAFLYKDGIVLEKYVKSCIYIDSTKQNVKFIVKGENPSFEKTVNFTVDYMTCSGDAGYLMHLSDNSALAIEPSLLGKYCKLTMHTPREEYDKMVFLFYQIE